jgi:hypothetical protein
MSGRPSRLMSATVADWSRYGAANVAGTVENVPAPRFR